MRWARVVGALLLALLLLMVAVLTWLANGTERLRRTIEDVVSEISDRPFTIEGEFDFELGRIVTVRAGNIRWRNAASSASPYMLEIGELAGSFDLLSVFDWPIVVTQVQARNATLVFEWHDQAGFNWRLGSSEPTRPKDSVSPDPLPLIIDQASVQNVNLRFRHPALTEELEIVVRKAEHQQDHAHRLVVSAVARLEDREFSIDGAIGPLSQLAVAGAVDFDVAVAGPLATLTATGKSARLAQLKAPEVVAELKAPSAAELAKRLKLPLDTAGSVQLHADVSTEGESIVAAANGSFGEFELDGRFRSESLTSLQGLDVVVRSSGPSLRDLAAIAGLSNLPEAPYAFEVRAQRTEQGLELQRFRLDTTGLNIHGSGIARAVPELRDIDLEVTAAGSNAATVAQLFDLNLKAPLPFELNAIIAGQGRGKNDAIDARLQLGSASARVKGSISEMADFSGSQLRFAVDAPDAQQLAEIAGIAAPAGARLQGRGSTSITTERILIENVEVSVADAELTGNAWLGRKPKEPALNFDGQVKGPNLAHISEPLLPAAARSTLPRLPFAASAQLRLAAASLDIKTASASVGRSKLGLSGRVHRAKCGMNLAGELSVRGESLAELLGGLGFDDIPDHAFSLKSRLRMSSDAIRFTQLSFTEEQVRIDGTLALIGKDYSRLEFDLSASGESLTDLIPDNDVYHPADVSFHVAAKGAATRPLIAIDRFRMRLGDARLAVAGELKLQPALAARGVRLQASGPRLSDLGEVGTWRFTDQPFKLSASLKGSAREQLIEELQFKFGNNNLSGRLRYLNQDVPFAEIALTSSRFNLDELRGHDPPEDESPATMTRHERLFSSDPLPFEVLDAFDAELSFQFDDLISRQRRWRNLVAEASLQHGMLHVRRAQVDAANGRLSARGTLKPTPAGRTIAAEITAANAMLALEGMTKTELDRLPRHAVVAELAATGHTPHELAASLEGFAWIIGGQGEVRRSALAPLMGDFLTELLGAVNPFAKTKTHSQLDCQGMYFEIANGTLETAPAIVMQTEHLVVLAAGQIDLASEKIDFTFETTPLKGLGVSVSDYVNPLTKVVGTLRRPRIALDPKGALVEGGAAVATAGLTILGKSLWKRWFGSRQICEKVAQEAVKIRKQRDPSAVPDLDKLLVGTRPPKSK